MSCPKGADPGNEAARPRRGSPLPAAGAAIEPREPDASWDDAFAAVLSGAEPDGERSAAVERSLRCVSSGYLNGGCACPANVPADVAEGAWCHELRGGRPEGFFRFTWRREIWLAYGLGDGSVRGVYCPAHGAERDRRAQGAGASALALGTAPVAGP